MTLSIYVASSWRNALQPQIVKLLREAAHTVYDFRNPAPDDHGFSWSSIDPQWQSWTPAQFRSALTSPPARRGFAFDMDALEACDVCVLVLPCGKSAHLELGYAVGAGKLTAVLMLEPSEPELMYKMCTAILTDIPSLLDWLSRHPWRNPS